MIKIYHNPRCAKSRQGIAFLEEKGFDYEVIKYLENTLSVKELKILLDQLDIKPIELIRKNEAIWKSDFKGKEFSNDELIEIMVKYPKLIERPIVVHQNKAVIARPIENIDNVL
ncbi:arsenate reductase [Wenyingzhuangia heitensis]|uniref:Arsenate reductase n=1 Tax=Wenyingzhuangia heitensis TaxID=1487859 RepID=A0ABX0U8R4_9FLAO|nr:arsenate reductase (glutaredoxin) [Wenyingzhuangia heitensis]NIJ44739.1 arsenate reductase [Wenyingzhuangia heitensis]